MSVCFAVVVDSGYQRYVPYFTFFCFRAYPDCGVRVCLIDEIESSYKKVFKWVARFGNVEYLKNEFDFLKLRNNIKIVRWILPESFFRGFDNVYIGDVDILISKEFPTLEMQHLENCERNQLPYSNAVRATEEKRLTGLHFIKKREYFSVMNPIIEKYADLLVKNKLFKIRNETVLYNMIVESGLGLPKIYFRPHHGLHLGKWRKRLPVIISQEFWEEIGKDLYRKYFEDFKEAEKKVATKIFTELFQLWKLIR